MPTIRHAVPDDLPAAVELWNRAAGPTRHAGQLREASRLLERDPHTLLLADDHGRLIGTLIVGWDGWRCHLYRLAVEPAARRSGVAQALVARARDQARALGSTRLDAMVNAENSGARAFWASAGFERETHDERWSFLL